MRFVSSGRMCMCVSVCVCTWKCFVCVFRGNILPSLPPLLIFSFIVEWVLYLLRLRPGAVDKILTHCRRASLSYVVLACMLLC